jgi:hypothetical protein
MKALAGFIVSGRFQAILVAALSGVLAFALPPLTTLIHYLGAAVVALVTLRVGVTQGLQVLIVATLLTVLFYLAAGTQAATVAVMVLLLWLPCWLVIRRHGGWSACSRSRPSLTRPDCSRRGCRHRTCCRSCPGC